MRDERKEQLIAWKQQRATPLSPTGSSTQRRRSSQSLVLSPKHSTEEDKPTTTATYTQQFLRRRRSQADGKLLSPKADNSPRANDSQDTVNQTPLDVPGTMDNSHQEPVASPSPTPDVTEKQQVIEEEMAVSGKGVTVENGEHHSGAINQVENEANLTMNKKRSRCGIVLAVASGLAIISVIGGLAVCLLYPSSSTAISIQMVANRAEEVLYARLLDFEKVVGPYLNESAELLQSKLLTLLENDTLTQVARAGAVLASEGYRDFLGLTNISTVMTVLLELMISMRGKISLAITCVMYIVSLVMAWIIKPLLQVVLELMELDLSVISDLMERVELFLLTVFLFLIEVLKQGATWARFRMEEVFEWMGLESDMSDAELPNNDFLAPLVAQQTTIQNIGRELTARESQALEDVKLSEKRREAIASAANSIISDTRVILDSVRDVKSAVMDLLNERIEWLADEYAASIEQELEEYKQTTQEVQEESEPGVVTEMVSEAQPQVTAAERLKRELAFRQKITDEKLSEASSTEYQSSTVGTEDEDANEEQGASDAELTQGDQPPVDFIEPPVSEEESLSQDALLDLDDNVEEAQLTHEVTDDKLPSAKMPEFEATKHSISADIAANTIVIVEQIEVTAGLAGPNMPIHELSAVAADEKSLDGDHAIEDQPVVDASIKDPTVVVAVIAEEKLQENEVATSDKETTVISELKQTVVTEVVVEVDDMVLEMEHSQVEVTNFYDAGNVSAVDNIEQGELHYEAEQTVAHLTVPVDGTEMELVVEMDTIAADTMDTAGKEKFQPDVSTRIAILAGTDMLEEDHKMYKNNMPKSTQDIDSQVDNELLASDVSVEVYENSEDSEAVSKVEVLVVEASLHSHDDTLADVETQEVDGVRFAISNEVDTLESDRVVAEMEIHELVQLEQVLLQEDERVRVEEELRLIAEEEEIVLQTEVRLTTGEASSTKIALDDRTAELMHANMTKENGENASQRSSLGFSLPRSALVRAALISSAFLSLVIFAVYLLTRYRKRGSYARTARQRKRWQRIADMDESDIEEVVLLSDDSSDDEVDDNDSGKEWSLEVEPTSSVKVETTVSQLLVRVEAEADEETSEDNEDVEEETQDLNEEEDVVQSDSNESAKLRIVGIEHLEGLTYTMDNAATPKSNAIADESDTASASISTPPNNSTLETPDTSQRAHRRLRREMHT